MRPTERDTDRLKSQIIAHRGFWFAEPGFDSCEPNSYHAIKRASESGFGLETDIRDQGVDISIEHDAFKASGLRLREISRFSFQGPVCLNIKADGLGANLRSLDIWENSVYFDLSVPEMVKYLKLGLTVASRISEYEEVNENLQSWIWIDAFEKDWWSDGHIIRKLLATGHQTIVVSPELHGREHIGSWHNLKPIFKEHKSLYLCTDYPVTAYEFMRS